MVDGVGRFVEMGSTLEVGCQSPLPVLQARHAVLDIWDASVLFRRGAEGNQETLLGASDTPRSHAEFISAFARLAYRRADFVQSLLSARSSGKAFKLILDYERA